jgi:hypothetical protein
MTLTVAAVLVIVVIDRIRFPVTKGQARDMAASAVQVSYPELSGLTPSKLEYEDENGNRIVSFSYIQPVNIQLDNGDTAQFTYGAMVTVNRNTGEVEVISIR